MALRRVEVQRCALLISALDGGERPASTTGRFKKKERALSTQRVGNCAAHRALLMHVTKINTPYVRSIMKYYVVFY
jgi:hypothetical protein